MRSPVVVSGSSGRIGAALCSHLRAAGTAVTGIDRRPGPQTAIVADLATVNLRELLKSGSVVVHCAALHAPHRGHVDDETFRQTNVQVTDRLVCAAAAAGIARFVFTSTTSVYGRVFDDPSAAVWVDESIEPQPRDIYDETKLAAEQIVADAHTDQMKTLTLRIARCFPEPHRDTVVHRLYRGVDLRDVVHALVRATDTAIDEHHTVNIAGPRVFERSDCVSLLGEAATIIAQRLPWLAQEFDRRGWTLPRRIDRVYVSGEAEHVLAYRPRHGVESSLDEPEGMRTNPLIGRARR